jgi:hypothetical protein
VLQQHGIRLVVAQVIAGVKDGSHYELGKLFGHDAFYDTLEEVVEAHRHETGTAAT